MAKAKAKVEPQPAGPRPRKASESLPRLKTASVCTSILSVSELSTEPDSDSPTSAHPPSLSDDNDHDNSNDSTEEVADMAPGAGRPGRPMIPRREADLSALLSPPEKTELTVLVARIMDSMQKQMMQTFDSTASDLPAPASARPSYWSNLPGHLKDITLSDPSGPAVGSQQGQRERLKSSISQAKSPTSQAKSPQCPPYPQSQSQPRPVTPDAGQHAGSQPPLPLPAPRVPQPTNTVSPMLQELKKETVLQFKKWQLSVQKRISDISVRRIPEGPMALPPTAPKKAGTQKGRGKPRGPDPLEDDATLARLFPPAMNQLHTIPHDRRVLLLHALLLLLLSIEHYGAWSRTLMVNITSSLHLPLRTLGQEELRVAAGLAQVVKDVSPEEIMQKRSEEPRSRKSKGSWYSSSALHGGPPSLPLPLVTAGFGTGPGGVGLGPVATAGLLAPMTDNTFAIGALFGLWTARAPIKMLEQLAKDVQDFGFLPLCSPSSRGEDLEMGRLQPAQRRLRVVVAVNGWMTGDDSITKPWRVLGAQSEVYALTWEMDSLKKMGTAMEVVMTSAAWSTAKKDIIARTIVARMLKGFWPVGLLKVSKIIDNPWCVASVRADKAGLALADTLLSKAQGERGVTLMGFSLGARVIYTCLLVLAEKRAFGLVENAVLMGTPCPAEKQVWCAMRSVVSGRLVNVFSENDYVLGFLYRMSSVDFGVAGLQQVTGCDGVENVDVSAKVSVHLRYQHLVGSILKHIGWEDVDRAQVRVDEDVLIAVERADRSRETKRDAVERGVSPTRTAVADSEGHKNDGGHEVIRTRFKKAKGKKK